MITRLILVALIAIALPSAPQQRRELTLQEKRGKAFYLRGESASGREITALMGEVDVPASTLPCAGCHGQRGEGRTEGGVTAGNMSWSHLTKPYGHTDEGGRKHQAFSESTFVRTMTAGLDPAGNKLAVAMPTYRMPQEDMANLIAYLKRIDTDNDPGVTDTTIVLGTVLPDKAALSGLSQSMGAVLQSYFAEINSHGGIYNRKIELRVMYGDSTATVTNVKHLIDDDQVFAIVSGLTAGAEDGVAQASAMAAARILVHALELCGKDLSRERLITTLEGLYEYDTGLMPKITFGPNRRIGALGAYVVTIDPEKKLFPASAEWIAVE